MKVWCDSVWDTAIGKTAGTFDPINSNKAEVVIQKRAAKSLLGFCVNAVPTVVTDAEVYPNLILRVTSQALGITNQEFALGVGGHDGDAVTSYAPITSRFIPFKQKPEFSNLFNADLSFTVAPNATTTGGVDIVVGVVYSDAEPDMQYSMELLSGNHKRVTGGDVSVDAAKAHGTGLVFVNLTKLSIPTGFTELEGFFAGILPNGIDASDPVSGVMSFTSSGIDDFQPQVWPLGMFFAPALGTVANSGHSLAQNRYWPTRFPLSGAQTDIEVQSLLLVAAGTAPDTTQGILYS